MTITVSYLLNLAKMFGKSVCFIGNYSADCPLNSYKNIAPMLKYIICYIWNGVNFLLCRKILITCVQTLIH